MKILSLLGLLTLAVYYAIFDRVLDYIPAIPYASPFKAGMSYASGGGGIEWSATVTSSFAVLALALGATYMTPRFANL